MAFPRAAIESQLNLAGERIGSSDVLDKAFTHDISLISGGGPFPSAFQSSAELSLS